LTADLPDWAVPLAAMRTLWHDYGIPAAMTFEQALLALKLDRAEKKRGRTS
jgi:hypothetical protein